MNNFSNDGEVISLLKYLIGEEADKEDAVISRVGELIKAKIDGETYDGPFIFRIEKLFAVYFGFANASIIDFVPLSRMERILFSKINGTDYDGEALSEGERLLLALGGGSPTPPPTPDTSNIVGTAKADFAKLTA